jgi:subtilisin family serine protease
MHAQNYTGRGISIAVIDYQFYTNRLSERELPIDRIQIFNGTFDEAECHGTACAEIIGDTAPDVTLYMVGLEELSQSGFIEAAEKLNRLDERIDIVSSSIDFSFGLFDEGDDICRAVNNLTRNGTIWITAAGDSAKKHWIGPFQDENENGFHEFVPGDESLNLSAERRDLIGVWLSWNDSWGQADQDFDLYLYSPDGTYAISRNTQEGYDSQEPAELVTMIAPVSGDYRIQIRRYSAPEENTSFQLFSTHNLTNYIVSTSSVGALASCSDVITVGAVDAQTLQLENYSSLGPTQDGRMKPELVAPDNITVSSYMPEMFRGSSASAPYAAGIFALALEKGRKMGMKDEEIVQLLLDSAIDLGPTGPENEYGYGLVNLKRFSEL